MPDSQPRHCPLFLFLLITSCGLTWLSCDTPPPASVRFVDVAASSGIELLNVSGGYNKQYIVEVKGGGAATFVDYDSDSDLDLYVINGAILEGFPPGQEARNALYRNDGERFVDVATQAGVDDAGWGMGCVAADYDNDGDADLLVTNFGPDVLYRNEGDGTFTDVTEAAGVTDRRWNTGAAFGDYDLDGDLDLYVASYIDFDPEFRPQSQRSGMWKGLQVMYGPRGLKGEPDVLYRNEGDGTFTDVTEAAGVMDEAGYYGFAVLFGDYDLDGDPDIYIANDSTPNFLYRNEGDGTFTDVAPTAGVAYSGDGVEQSGMGACFGDYDNDGRPDLIVTNFADDYNTLYHNEGHGFFSDITFGAGELGEESYPFVGWGVGFIDYDNDADLDIFVANGHVYPEVDTSGVGSYRQTNQMFRNDDGHFQEESARLGPGLAVAEVSRGAAFGDYDNDGDIDIAVVNMNSTPSLLRNDGGNRHHWLQVKTVGVRSNRDGIGARVRVTAGGVTQMREVSAGSSFLSGNDLRLHFGLGRATVAERVEINWPSGTVDNLQNVSADQILIVREGRETLR